MNKQTNRIESKGDGIHKVTISFDITDQGHIFGSARNYPLGQVQKMVRSKSVQKAIRDGYAICMYGHGARSKSQGYLANESNAGTGEVQEPIGRVDSLSIRDKIITYTMTLVETEENKVKSVVRLIKNKIGGFSAVMNVPKGIFYGFDFVLSPNFNGNRVVMDSICSDGACGLSDAVDDVVFDAIGDNKDLFDEAKELLEHQDNVYQAIEFKEKMSAKMDSIQKEIAEKDDVITNLNIKLESKSKNITSKDSIISALKKDVRNAIESNEKLLDKNDELVEENNKLKESIQTTQDSIQGNGLKIIDDKVTVDGAIFGELFLSDGVSVDPIDKTTLDNLSKPVKKNPTLVEWGY